MGVFLGVLIFALFVGAIAFAIFSFKHKKRISGIVGMALTPVFLVLFIFIPFGFTQVEAGEVAVVKSWGQVKEYKTAGLHFRNIVSEKYELYDTKVQQLNLNKWCYVQDETGTTQVVQVYTTVQFTINESGVTDISVEYGTLDALKIRLTTVVLGVLESNAAEYSLKELVTGAGKIEYQNAVRQSLTEDVDKNNKTVEQQFYISFRQITIEEFVLEEALENAMLKARIEQTEREIKEANEKILREIALANAKNEEEVARLLGEAKKAESEAEISILVAKAKGEAEALRIKSIELARSIGIGIIVTDGEEAIDLDDDNIALLESYLKYIAYLEKWDGKLPDVVGGDIDMIIPKP